MYSELPNGNLLREDGAIIPPDPNNRDYMEYLRWEADGGELTPPPTVVVHNDLNPVDRIFGGDPWQF